MIKIYEAANGAEAHLILNLLQQAGLNARVDGEFLQGGIGDLQISGLVRVMIDESDYKQGRELIEEWNSTDVDGMPNDYKASQVVSDEIQTDKVKEPLSNSNDNLLNLLIVSLISLVIGIVITYVFFRTPVTENGIDFDGDGIPDEWWIYKGGSLSEARVDRNLDKAIDLYYYYDYEGLLKSMKADDDFDGVFESETKFNNNNAIWTKSDTTGDGYKNYQMKFSDGVVDTISFWDAQTKKIVKVDYYKGIQLSYSQIDTNGDGVLDTKHYYDEYENIKTAK